LRPPNSKKYPGACNVSEAASADCLGPACGPGNAVVTPAAWFTCRPGCARGAAGRILVVDRAGRAGARPSTRSRPS
jgi:hypothetical protein